MAYLTPALRRTLERTIQQARASAQEGAADALRRLGVAEPRRPAHLTETQAQFRNRLRAHARALGDALTDGTQAIDRLTEQAAYVQWHRLLFARFLLERRLLRHPDDGGDLALLDCREEAATLGLADEWAAAAHYSARLLPGVFPPNDPAEAISLAPEHARALRQHLLSLDAEMFAAEDTLGWTYQFWRSQEKVEINASGRKIGATELPAVTQLFTEPCMVQFLLHNTLGAWWAGRVLEQKPELAEAAADEVSLRRACSPPGYVFDMLRFVKEGDHWRPAAGVFSGWPRDAREINVLDPCCGSGHFLTEALAILVAFRQTEEGLSAPEAAAAVLRDNLFGLEIDGRCVQIAAFAVALAAWRLAGWQSLPLPHIAWSGARPPLPKAEFVALANGDNDQSRALGAIHDLFRQAPLLGSLIEPTGGDLIDPVRIARIEEMLEPVIELARAAEPERAEGAIAARGMADAAAILARRFMLQATNVPFLGRGKQDAALKDYLAARFGFAKADLATAMLTRMRALAALGGTVASVTPQNWLFLGSYKKMREALLAQASLVLVAILGEHGFDSSAAAGAFTALVTLTEARPDGTTVFAGLDANDAPDPAGKAAVLGGGEVRVLGQAAQLRYPDSMIAVVPLEKSEFLTRYASCYQGTSTADNDRCVRTFWEVANRISRPWDYFAGPPERNSDYGGMTDLVDWLTVESGATNPAIRGEKAWGQVGLIFGQMRDLPSAQFAGTKFGNSSPVLIVHEKAHLAAVASFVWSGAFLAAMRTVNKKVSVDNGYITKVPFDLAHWQKIAAQQYPNGLPEPYSNDPTQWLFHGHPAKSGSGTALHIALARLCGYRWPAETDAEMHLSLEARDLIAKAVNLPAGEDGGMLALPAVAGERPLVERLRGYLAAAFGGEWSDALERQLVAEADEVLDKRSARDGSLEAWLRDRAFHQHCALFHQRPFLWHVWDGQADGFGAFLHYHRLTRANLEKLTYSLLGDWIARMRDAGDQRRLEASLILQEKLQAILKGETPLDIFVRWKPLVAQPIGWNPDLDDGVRLSIRPFVRAGILRDTPNIHWRKDRGRDVPSAPWYAKFNGDRMNDHTLTLAEKQEAREAATSRVA